MLRRFASFRVASCCSVLVFALPPALLAQNRDEYARAPKPRPDVTIFSPLELPTPNRVRTASGAPGPDYWQQRVDYRIEARLDPIERRLTGNEHVTYHNNSPDALDYLWVHLEQNILRKDSIGSLVNGGAAVGGLSDNTEGVVLSRVAAAGAPLPFKVYDTLMRVDLGQPLPAGSKLELQIDWSFEIPHRIFRRYGTMEVAKGTIWELAQWFPAVAVYDDVRGWNTLPYVGTGEFYTNFGNVDLAITVPRDHLVVASGVLQNASEVLTTTQQERLA